MARIPNDQLERIKSEVSLLELVKRQGYEVKKQGKDYAIRCPFHDDKTPLMMISPDKNVFNCFGCGASGTVIDWVMKTQGVSFRHAVEVLAVDNPLSQPVVAPARPAPATYRSSVNIKQSGKRQLDTLPTDQSDQVLLNQVIDFYHETLLNNPDALAYLDKRGLNNPELIKHFKLVFANRNPAGIGRKKRGQHSSGASIKQ